MDVIEITAGEIAEKNGAPDELLPALPVCIGERVAAPEEAPGTERETKRRIGAARILSFFISAVLCSVSLFYIASRAVALSKKVDGERVKAALLNEVFAGAVPETAPESVAVTEAETEEPVVTSPASADAPEKTEPPVEVAPNADSYPIVKETLANTDLLTAMSNTTSYSPDLPSLLDSWETRDRCAEIYEKYGADAPVALIVHTHGTEAYTAEGKDTYTEDDPFRSTDPARNVVSVGGVIAEVFEREGINTIHCGTMFDEESYRDSYSKSYAEVKKYLEEYPSISFVFDVHRDSVIRDDMTNIATLSYFNGDENAQAMIVVGTDEGGADHPSWRDNLSFALAVQKNMIGKSETLPRRINLRSAAFNQGLCPGYLLLEIGSCANTLNEAKRAAVLTAMSVAEAIRGRECSVSAEEMISLFAS